MSAGDTGNWTVVTAPSAKRQLFDRLPWAVAAACFEFIEGPLAEKPHRVGTPLRKPFEDQRRAKRGHYRIRYLIDEKTRTVHVVRIEHRRDAYRT